MKFRFHKSTLVWGIVFLIGVLGIAYLLLRGMLPQYSVTGSLLRQEKAVAKAEADNIQSYFESFGGALADLSELPDIQKPNGATVGKLKEFVDKRVENGMIGGVVFTDKDGLVTYHYSIPESDGGGVSLANRDYFTWAKKQAPGRAYFVGDAVISKVGATEGEYIVPVAAPVFNKGVFVGVLVSSVRLNSLTDHYLSTLRISDSTEVYIVNDEGYVLCNHTQPGKIGLKIDEFKKGSPFASNELLNIKIRRDLMEGEEGGTTATYVNSVTGLQQKHTLAYYPVKFMDKNWLVVLSSPSTTLTAASAPAYINYVGILSLLTLLVATLGVIFFRRSK